MTALSVALGVDIASGLLQEAGSHGSSHALHAGAFLLAAPAAPAGVTFFIAVAVASFAMGAFPRPTWRLAVIGAVANVGALGGVASLQGPLSSGNGLIGGTAAPLGIYVLWILAVSLSWLGEGARTAVTAGAAR